MMTMMISPLSFWRCKLLGHPVYSV